MDKDWPINCRQLSDDENLEESYCMGGEGGKLLAPFWVIVTYLEMFIFGKIFPAWGCFMKLFVKIRMTLRTT